MMTFIETVYGKDGVHRTPYLTRIKLTPKTPWGQLMFHIFHRGDADDHPHDHPWDFWTFPLNSYVEECWCTVGGNEWHRGRAYWPGESYMLKSVVRAWRWHFRPAEYMHRVLHSYRYPTLTEELETYYSYAKGARLARSKRIWTLVWAKPKRRSWFFLVDGVKVPWREYVFGKDEA